MTDASGWRMAKYKVMYSGLYLCCDRVEKNVSLRDHLFELDVAKKAFKKF